MNYTVITFLSLIVISFLKLIFYGDTTERILQKIIGGLAVFVIALISMNTYIIWTSLFIGGLIIASEKFIQSIAAILRTNSASIPSTISALNNTKLSEATKSEISIEKNNEIEAEKRLARPDDKQNYLSFTQRQEIEKKIINLLERKYVANFSREIKLENEYGKIVVDGVVHESSNSGNINLNNVLGLVEISYLPKNIGFSLEYRVRRVLEKIRYLLINKQILIVFYSDNINEEYADEVRKSLYEKFPKNSSNLVFGFICVDEKNLITEIYLPSLKDHIK